MLAGLGLLAVIVVVVLVIVLSSSGSSTSSSTRTTAGVPTPTTSSSATTTATSTTAGTAAAKPIAQVNLLSPTGGKPKGVAIIVKQGPTPAWSSAPPACRRTPGTTRTPCGSTTQPPTTTSGFVNPGVGTTQVLQTAGALPANASHFKQLLVMRRNRASRRPRARSSFRARSASTDRSLGSSKARAIPSSAWIELVAGGPARRKPPVRE